MAAAELSPTTVHEVTTKGWMTHDAMWFFSCLQQLGIEKANELNKSAIALLAAVETRRMLDALGMRGEPLDSFDKLRRFFAGARTMVIPDWMDFSLSFDEENVLRWRWNKCFAHDGVQRIGAIDQYQCGVMFRIECWLQALGVKYEMRPPVRGCLMHQCGECKGTIRFFFEK